MRLITSNQALVDFCPVPPEEMAFALALFVSAANGQLLAGSAPHSEWDDRDCRQQFGTLFQASTFEDSPEQDSANPQPTTHYSAFRAVWREYEGDERRSSLCARVLSFHLLMLKTRGGAVAEWLIPCPDSPDSVLLHPGIVDAVASIGISDSRQWEEESFRKAVVPYIALHPPVAAPKFADSVPNPFSQYLGEEATSLQGIGANAKQMAEMILTCETVERDAAVKGLSAHAYVYEILREPLSSLTGIIGFRCLLERALRLGQREAPELAEMEILSDGSLAGLDRTPKEAVAALIAHLILLPAALVGPEVTVRLLHRSWPSVRGLS